MSEFKGTPGPWKVYRGPMNMNGGLNPFFKGIVALLKHSGEDDDTAVITDTDRPAFEDEANAYLIAAAPELLAALFVLGQRHDFISTFTGLQERWYTCWCHFGCESDNPTDHEPECNAARAAIAQALGDD